MWSMSDLFDENFQIPLKFFNQIVSNPVHVPLIRISNTPLLIPRVTHPFQRIISVKIQQSARGNTDFPEDFREPSCIGNTVNTSGESLLLECSRASLNLCAPPEDEADSCGRRLHGTKMASVEGQDVRGTPSNHSLRHLMSTSSSTSSLKEYYLPAITDSTATVGTNSRIMTKKRFLKNQTQLHNPESAQNYPLEPVGETRRSIRDAYPFQTRRRTLEDNKKLLQMLLKRNATKSPLKKEEVLHKAINQDMVQSSNDVGCSLKGPENFHNTIKGNNVQTNDCGINYYTLRGQDNFIDTVDSKLDGKNIFKGNYEIGQVTKAGLHKTTASNAQKSSIPDPNEWIREIQESKLVIKQDIIEKDFSSRDSPRSQIKNSYSDKPNAGQPNIFVIPGNCLRSENHQEFCEMDNLRNKIYRYNNQKMQGAEEDGSPELAHFKEVLLNIGKTKNDQEISYTLLPANCPSGSINTPMKGEYFDSTFRPKQNDFPYPVVGKFQKLPGLLDEIMERPNIKKMLIENNVVTESSGLIRDGADLLEQPGDGQNIMNSNQKKTPGANEEPRADKSKARNSTEIQIKRSKGDISLDRSFYIYSESVPTDIVEFQRLKDFFDYNKRNYGMSSEKFTVVSRHNDSKEVLCKISCEKVEDANTVEPAEGSTRIKPRKSEEHSLKLETDTTDTSDKDIQIEELPSMLGNKITVKEGKLFTNNGHPVSVFNKSGFPLTDLKGRILKDNRGIPLVDTKNIGTVHKEVYDAENFEMENPNFDPGRKPVIRTLVKIRDQARVPAALYNNLGQPLTDEEGFLLHDSKGNILVTVDSNFFPLCCKTGMPIYLRNGTSWLSQRCKFTVTTQHKATEAKATDTKATASQQSLFTNITNNSACEILDDEQRHVLKVEKNIKNDAFLEAINESNVVNMDSKTEYSTSSRRFPQTIKDVFLPNNEEQKHMGDFYEKREPLVRMQFDIDGNHLTDAEGYPLTNAYGELMLLYDKEGYPISDWCGGQLFNSKGTPLDISRLRRTSPERPYSENNYDKENCKMISQKPNYPQPHQLYQHNEPLINIVKNKDIRALNINRNLLPETRRVYFPPQHYKTPAGSTLYENAGRYNYQTNYMMETRDNNYYTEYESGEPTYQALEYEEYEKEPTEYYQSPDNRPANVLKAADGEYYLDVPQNEYSNESEEPYYFSDYDYNDMITSDDQGLYYTESPTYN